MITTRVKPLQIEADAALFFRLPDQRTEHILAIHAQDWALTVNDIAELLRDKLKYGHSYATPTQALEDIRAELHRIMDRRGISLDMLA